MQIRRLNEGEHFGEIQIIYSCARTASVISMNYNTFATMDWHGYKRLIQDFPEYEVCLRRHVVSTYDDHRIKFIANMIKRVEYLDLVPIDILYELIFSLKSITFEKNDIILECDSMIDSIYFVEQGTV